MIKDMNLYKREWKKNNKDSVRRTKKKEVEKRRLLKIEVINHYGGKCQCCGESRIEFMTIDHIKRDGAIHRKRVGHGIEIYKDIKRNGFPSGEYRPLCFNCNISLGINGYCPHSSPNIDFLTKRDRDSLPVFISTPLKGGVESEN